MIKRKRIVSCLLIVLFCTAVLLADEGSSRNLNEEDQLIHVGIGAFQDGFYDIAEKQFSLFIRNFPGHGKIDEVFYLLGKTFLFQGKWKEAKAAFSRILLDNRNFESMDYALFWMAQVEMNLGNLEPSRKYLLSLLKNYPKFEWIDHACYLLGCVDLEAARWKLAEGSFKRVVTLSKRKDLVRRASFWLGMAFLKQDDFETAALYLKPFQEGAGPLSDPYYKHALLGLGEAQFKLGRYEEAKRNYRAFYDRYKQDPLIPDVSWRMGFCAYRSGDLAEALDLFKIFQSQFRESPLLLYVHYLLGEIFLLEGDHASSIKTLNQVLQSPQPHFLWGTTLVLLHWNYLVSGEPEEAHRVYQRVFKLNTADDEKYFIQWLTAGSLFAEGRIADALPYYFSILNSKLREKVLFQIGKGYFFENQLREALTNLDLLLLESPNLKSLDAGLFLKGESLLRLDDMPRALEAYGQILALSRKTPWALMALTQVGMNFLSEGENERSERSFERILRDYPSHPLFYHAAFRLGNLYGERKDFPQASHAYSLVLNGPVPELLGPTYFRIGEILIQQEKEEMALTSFEAALRSVGVNSPWYGITQLEIGNLLRRAGHDRAAKKSFRAVFDQSKDEKIKKAAGDLLERLDRR